MSNGNGWDFPFYIKDEKKKKVKDNTKNNGWESIPLGIDFHKLHKDLSNKKVKKKVKK
tara:strand:- start:2386 stop:2559 length:174 start_codon:yes stop_codon:yes gene_type:complete